MFASIPGFWEFYIENEINDGGKECLRLLNEIIGDFDEVSVICIDHVRVQYSYACAITLFCIKLLERPKYCRIEKIKTIGSTYMAASGLSDGDDSATQAVISMARFAHDIQKKLDGINKHSFNDFKLKIGRQYLDTSVV